MPGEIACTPESSSSSQESCMESAMGNLGQGTDETETRAQFCRRLETRTAENLQLLLWIPGNH